VFWVPLRKSLPLPHLWVPGWESFGTRVGCHATSTLSELRREHGAEKQSPIQELQPGAGPTRSWSLDGEGPWRQCLSGWTTHEGLGCEVAVGSQPLGAWRVLRQLLPGLWLWQPGQPSRKKLEGGGPVSVGSGVLPLGPGQAGHVGRGPMGDLSTPGLSGPGLPS
jgi:hypothetical protein